MKTSTQSKTPLWRKSMLQKMSLSDITDMLEEIAGNGDPYGYEYGDESGYYAEYKDQFDELSAQAGILQEEIMNAVSNKYEDEYEFADQWNDITVAMLGDLFTVMGYDSVEMDYYGILNSEEEWAQEEARKRLERLTKAHLLDRFAFVWKTMLFFFDIKTAHDCLTAIVEELDEKGAILEKKNEAMDRLYEDITGKAGDDFGTIINNLPQRMWVE